MKQLRTIILFIIGVLLISPIESALSDTNADNYPHETQTSIAIPSQLLNTPNSPQNQNKEFNSDGGQFRLTDSEPQPSPTPDTTPDPFADLYNCEMALKFINGPLETRAAEFEVLGKDYFADKGDKFAPGRGTSIFYEEQRYFILHSSYVDGNILKPMEAEFIRRYLENWGKTGTEQIKQNINSLIGSEAIWVCNGKLAFKTEITGIVRLSHAASERLWLEPRELDSILADQEGLASEWVGGINEASQPALLVGFCGWGPNSIESGRYTYFRYLIQFEIELISNN